MEPEVHGLQEEGSPPCQPPCHHGGAPGQVPEQACARKERKRVRFTEDPPQVHEIEPQEQEEQEMNADKAICLDELACKRKKARVMRTRLPGEDAEDLDETDFQREDQGAIKDFNPAVAAKRRAAQREEIKRRNAIMDVSIIPADIADAEEEYDEEDEDEERFLTGDIPIEPFNLKHERETGYFDVWGNYIEYQLKADARDAWLDSLGEGPKSMRRPKASSASLVADAEQELDKEDIALYKRRMIAMLEPGENAFAALRRLGSRPMPPPPKQKHQPQEILGSTAARQRQRKQHRQQQQQQLKVAEADGVQGINTAAGAAEAARDRGQVAFDRGSVHSVDGAAGKGGSSDGSSSSNSSSRGGSGTRIEGNGEAGAAKRGARGSEMESPAEFHKLTEYAQLLLGCGELSIYTKTKEQLAREVVAAGSPPPGQQRPQVRGNDRDDDAEGRRLVEALLSGATPVSQEAEAAVATRPAPTPEALCAPFSSRGQAHEDDRDMFGESFEVTGGSKSRLCGTESTRRVGTFHGLGPDTAAATSSAASGSGGGGGGGEAPATNSAGGSSAPAANAATLPASAQEGAPTAAGAVALSEAIQGGPTAQQHVDPDLLRQLEILEAPPAVPELPPGQPGCSDVGTHAVQPSDGIAPQQQQQQQQQWMVNGGFALDADSGMYYSSSLGLWYNGSTGLYMDAQTGSWYRVNEAGGYEAAPEAGHGFGTQPTASCWEGQSELCSS